MRLFETIADRRIAEGRAAGLFDNLPGRGKPIADLHEERPPGWWAARAVTTERDIARHQELTAELRAARPGLWRLGSEPEVQAEIDRLNDLIDGYNRRTSFDRIDRLHRGETLTTWRELRHRDPLAP